MPLNKLEREVITDSMLKIQSIRASLDQIAESKIPDFDDILCCLRTADRSFRIALRDTPQKKIKR